MTKRLSFPLTSAIILFFITIALSVYYYSRSNVTTDTDTVTPLTYTTVTDNELVILHSNVPVTADASGVQLTLVSHSKTVDAVASSIDVADVAGSALGTIQFTAIDETQTLANYRFRLVSATNSAIQVLVLATAEANPGE